jgi:preprotein translocase subunit SecA
LRGQRLAGDIMDMLRGMVEDLVKQHYGEGNLDELRADLLRLLALDVELDREMFHKLGEDGVIDRVYDDALTFYNRKRNALARPFFESMKQLQESDREQKPEKVYVDFTDGRKALRAVVRIEDAIESEGQEVNDALERVAMLSFIDAHWTEHLRNLDEVKEGIGLRAYGQRDPLIEYKMEAYGLFTEMIDTINRDMVSFIFRSGPLVNQQTGAGSAGARPRRLDPRRSRTTHESMSPTYGVGAGGDGRRAAAEADPTSKAEPVTVDDKVGRNDPCPCGSGKKYKHCHGAA